MALHGGTHMVSSKGHPKKSKKSKKPKKDKKDKK